MTAISIVHVEEELLLALRTTATFAEVPGKLLPLTEQVDVLVREQSIGAGRHVWFYRNVGASGMEVDVGIQVPAPVNPPEGYVLSATPGGPAVHAALPGEVDEIRNLHQAIHRWCSKQGHTLAGPCWEVYSKPGTDPAAHTIDLYHLLA